MVTLNKLRTQTMPCQTTSMAQEELESSYNRLKHGILKYVCLKQKTFIKAAADYLQLFCRIMGSVTKAGKETS